jgi:rhamnosyl/mannosyltransferase
VPPGVARALKGKRVLHVGKFYPPHMGGMETHVQALCEELQRFVKVEVLVANDARETAMETIGGVHVTRLGTALNLAAAPVCPSMIRKIRDADADIVHIHLPNPTAILAYLASGHRGRLILTYHSDIIRQKLLGRAFWPFLRHALGRADAVIATSPNYIETSPALAGFKEKCRVLPFGIDVEQFRQVDSTEVAEIRKRYGDRIVLGVGRLVYYKGFEYLIRAMRDVDAHLVIVGDGPLREGLQAEVRAHGLADKVTIATEVKRVQSYYHAAKVFVLPSIARSEAFGIVQLEAMACGVPVINTKLDSGVPFVSRHEESGLTVAPADANALSQAINSLLDNPALSAQYGEAGRKRVGEEFSSEKMTRSTLELYANVLAGNCPPSLSLSDVDYELKKALIK